MSRKSLLVPISAGEGEDIDVMSLDKMKEDYSITLDFDLTRKETPKKVQTSGTDFTFEVRWSVVQGVTRGSWIKSRRSNRPGKVLQFFPFLYPLPYFSPSLSFPL